MHFLSQKLFDKLQFIINSVGNASNMQENPSNRKKNIDHKIIDKFTANKIINC